MEQQILHGRDQPINVTRMDWLALKRCRPPRRLHVEQTLHAFQSFLSAREQRLEVIPLNLKRAQQITMLWRQGCQRLSQVVRDQFPRQMVTAERWNGLAAWVVGV